MKKIRYYYSSMSKQVFLILLSLFIISRFVIFSEVIFFDINNYSDTFNIGGSIILYVFYLLFCAFFFFGYKFFYTTYDKNHVIYHNILLRKKHKVDLTLIDRALLNKHGIYLYYEKENKHCILIPFYRLGVISPVGVDEFYRLLKSKNIEIEKSFTVLPGSRGSNKLSSAIYTGLALLTLGYLTQSIALAVAILKNH